MRCVLVLVVALAGLFSAAFSATAQEATPVIGSTAGQSAAGLVRTDVRYFLPFTSNGVNPSLAVSGNESGVCDAGSVSDPARPDAWLCTGGAVLDPCFENPFAPPDEQGVLVCSASPFDPGVVLFTPTEPLVRLKDAESGGGPDPRGSASTTGDAAGGDDAVLSAADLEELPWALELANGERCTFARGATAAFAGMRLNYFCDGGGAVLGDVDIAGQVWTATYLPENATATSLVEVAVGWY